MKKEYKMLALHEKPATVREKGEFAITRPTVFFDKKDVEGIVEIPPRIFNRNESDDIVDNFLKKENVRPFSVCLKSGNKLTSVLLSKKELAYLCED